MPIRPHLPSITDHEIIICHYIGNDEVIPSDTEKGRSLVPDEYKDDKPFTVVSCGALTPFLAFAGLSEQGQENVAGGASGHRVICFDIDPKVNQALVYYRYAVSNTQNFEAFEHLCLEELKFTYRKSIDPTELDKLLLAFKDRCNSLKTVFSSQKHGFNAFKRLVCEVRMEVGDWIEPDQITTLLQKFNVNGPTLYYPSNILDVLFLHVIKPSSTLTQRQLDNMCEHLTRLPNCIALVLNTGLIDQDKSGFLIYGPAGAKSGSPNQLRDRYNSESHYIKLMRFFHFGPQHDYFQHADALHQEPANPSAALEQGSAAYTPAAKAHRTPPIDSAGSAEQVTVSKDFERRLREGGLKKMFG